VIRSSDTTRLAGSSQNAHPANTMAAPDTTAAIRTHVRRLRK
jgi:hypothetical protein